MKKRKWLFIGVALAVVSIGGLFTTAMAASEKVPKVGPVTPIPRV
jgi:hypothetical protein